MKMAVHDGIDYRKGPDCRRRVLDRRWLPERPGVSRACLGVRGRSVAQRGHGGRLAVILMTLFVEITKPRRSRIEAAFDLSVLPTIREFLGAFASRSGWDAAMAERLDAACEETLLTLVRQEKEEERRLRLVAYREGSGGGSRVRRGVARRECPGPACSARRGARRGGGCRSGCCAGSRPPFAISSIVAWMW